LGSAFGAVVGFSLGKKYGLKLSIGWLGEKKVKKIEHGINTYGKWIVGVAAFSPLPYISIVFGALDMSWRNFILYGMIPRAISFILLAIYLI